MQLLDAHVGSWTGANRFRLTPVDPPHEAPATLQVSTGAAGRLATVRYTWEHPEDGSQEGLLTLGPTDGTGAVVALWGDSWHQTPEARVLTGEARGGVVRVGYTYAGDWSWTIVLDAAAPDALLFRMDNVVPASAEAEGLTPGAYWAMASDLSRAG